LISVVAHMFCACMCLRCSCDLPCAVKDIGHAWKLLEDAEKGFEEWLLSEMQR